MADCVCPVIRTRAIQRLFLSFPVRWRSGGVVEAEAAYGERLPEKTRRFLAEVTNPSIFHYFLPAS